MHSSSLASPTLRPVRLDLCNFLGIFKGLLVVLFRGIGGGTVGVEDVVGGLDGDGLGELVAGVYVSTSAQNDFKVTCGLRIVRR